VVLARLLNEFIDQLAAGSAYISHNLFGNDPPLLLFVFVAGSGRRIFPRTPLPFGEKVNFS